MTERSTSGATAIADHGTAAAAVSALLDPTGRVVWAGRTLVQTIGHHHTLVGKQFSELLCEKNTPQAQQIDLVIRQAAQDTAIHATIDSTALGRVRLDIEPMPTNTGAALHVTIEQAGPANEQDPNDESLRYALAAQSANDGLWDWDLVKDVIHYSSRWAKMVGLDPAELTTSPDEWFNRIASSDLHQLHADVAMHTAGATKQLRCEQRIKHVDGEYRWVLCRGKAVFDDQNNAIRLAGSLTDITEMKHAEDKLRQAALHDRLTGLPNRRMLTDHLHRAVQKSADGPKHQSALLFLDFDRFKLINDSMGHDVGDLFLITIAKRLRESIRKTDMAARLGGDEFVIHLDPAESLKEVTDFATALQETLSAPYNLDGRHVTSSASIGIAMCDGAYEKPEDLLRNADTAMYHAKTTGKAKHVVFDQEMHNAAVRRLEMETALTKAVDARQFVLHYQPIINLHSRQIEGFEALARWQHPEHGLLEPEDFIPVAEETGAIVSLGWQLAEMAAEQLKTWRDEYPHLTELTVCMNVARRQLVMPDWSSNLRELIERIQIDPAMFQFEITETTIVSDADVITPVLQQMRDIGVKLGMDDFGTGQSSLSCLDDFPIDVLKIDRAFVHNIDRERSFPAIINAIVGLAHNLGMKVVAEGVEMNEQVALLQALDCDACQGYFFARPMSPEETTQFLNEHPDGVLYITPAEA